MKRKLTRKSLDELALIMPVLSEDVQRRYVGVEMEVKVIHIHKKNITACQILVCGMVGM